MDKGRQRMKGSTEFDKLCHKVFAATGYGRNYLLRDSGVACRDCGAELGVYYCEERLYMVECTCCEKKALVEASSPEEAAYGTFASPVYSLDDFPNWHHRLTGSCLAGRNAFIADKGLTLDGATTVADFIKLTKDAYGCSTIRKLPEAYGLQSDGRDRYDSESLD